jgi:hypothetical protein
MNERVRCLVDDVLADRAISTRAAYASDLAEFGRFLGQEPAAAFATLMACGERGAAHMAQRYALELRRRGCAPATVRRRLATLRVLMGRAQRSTSLG